MELSVDKNEKDSTNEMDNLLAKPVKNKTSLRFSKVSRKSQKSEVEAALSEDEIKYLIVKDISEEIVKTSLDQIYENYLEKQTVYFVSHCSRLAWKALVEWNFQQRDKGGYREADKDKADVEPQPSPKDSWAGQSVPIDLEQTRRSRIADMESQTEDVSPVVSPMSMSNRLSRKETPSQISQRVSKPQSQFKHSKFAEKLLVSRTKKSDDTGTPAFRVDVKGDKSTRQDEGKKDTYELPSPVPLQTKHFPSSRVEVQYAIMAGNKPRANNLASKDELKTKTIVLKKPIQDESKSKTKPKVS